VTTEPCFGIECGCHCETCQEKIEAGQAAAALEGAPPAGTWRPPFLKETRSRPDHALAGAPPAGTWRPWPGAEPEPRFSLFEDTDGGGNGDLIGSFRTEACARFVAEGEDGWTLFEGPACIAFQQPRHAARYRLNWTVTQPGAAPHVFTTGRERTRKEGREMLILLANTLSSGGSLTDWEEDGFTLCDPDCTFVLCLEPANEAARRILAEERAQAERDREAWNEEAALAVERAEDGGTWGPSGDFNEGPDEAQEWFDFDPDC
jgi:hypothetical protein